MIKNLARRRIFTGVGILSSVVILSTAWFSLVEHFTFVDALYQTMITVSTVGFQEVHPLDASSRLFTIGVILVGVSAAFYTLSGLFEQLVAEQVEGFGRRRMERKIEHLEGHLVLCGFGRIGSKIAELVGPDLAVAVIDSDEERCEVAGERGFLALHGDATDDDLLSRARLERASVLVAALPTDADNLYVALSGRACSADLHIVARAQSVLSEAKLMRAGANRVVNPEDIGARRMAAFVLKPTVSEFVDVVFHHAGVQYRLEEVFISAGSSLEGKTIAQASIRDRTGALVVAILSPGGELLTNPPPETELTAGVTLIAMGTDEQLGSLVSHSGADLPLNRMPRFNS